MLMALASETRLSPLRWQTVNYRKIACCGFKSGVVHRRVLPDQTRTTKDCLRVSDISFSPDSTFVLILISKHINSTQVDTTCWPELNQSLQHALVSDQTVSLLAELTATMLIARLSSLSWSSHFVYMNERESNYSVQSAPLRLMRHSCGLISLC